MIENYTLFERRIANYLNKFPKIKQYFKRGYQLLNFIVFHKRYKIKMYLGEIYDISKSSKETFFGYYDKSPVNSSGSYIIYHETSRKTFKKPSPTVPINIVLQNLFNGNQNRFKSYSYNWQQGTRLQWLDDVNFIFNDYDFLNNDYCSYKVNSKTGEVVDKFPFPIYDSFNNYGYTLCFDRLALLRPDYGYRNNIHTGLKININNINDDGIFFCNFINKTKKLIISLKYLSTFNLNVPSNTLHKVNHIMISPDGTKFVFLHRYFVNGEKFDRLMLSDKYGNNVKLLTNSSMVSHYCWINSNQIVVYMRDFELGENYYLLDVLSGNRNLISKNVIKNLGDGHPSFFSNFIVFDTYPNKARMAMLYLYNINNCSLQIIGEFFSPLKFSGESRCDLHPRWSQNDKSIFIDTVYSGKRKLINIKIDSII